MMMMKNKILNIIKSKNKTSGVTLIALTITIIILLILAGISIATLTGENGIINKAENAKFNTEKGDIENQINIMTTQSVNKKGKLDKEILIGKLQTLPDGKEIVDDDTKIYVIYPDYAFEIDLGSGKTTNTVIEKIEDTTPGELAGNGTKEEPYLIESIEDLVAFSNNVNSGTTYQNKFIKLSRTLDFNSPFSYVNPKTKVSEKTNRIITEDTNGTEIKTFLTTGTGFNPIGNKNKSFMGDFDGNGKDIKNIYVNRLSEDYIGLFGNSGISNITIIYSLGLSGNVIGNDVVGGISGEGGNIKECFNEASVTGKQNVGGIMGRSCNVDNSYNKGTVKIINSDYGLTSASSVGGIGDPQTNGYINNSYNIGEIQAEKAYGMGGISGFFGNLKNCVNLGKVNYIGEGKTSLIGGVCGGTNNTFVIENCYNFGSINYEKAYNNGAILAYNYVSNVKNSYYLEGTAQKGVGYQEDEVGVVEALNESQMPKVIDVVQNQIEVDGKMINAWKEDTNNINNGYPILWWQ